MSCIHHVNNYFSCCFRNLMLFSSLFQLLKMHVRLYRAFKPWNLLSVCVRHLMCDIYQNVFQKYFSINIYKSLLSSKTDIKRTKIKPQHVNATTLRNLTLDIEWIDFDDVAMSSYLGEQWYCVWNRLQNYRFVI